MIHYISWQCTLNVRSTDKTAGYSQLLGYIGWHWSNNVYSTDKTAGYCCHLLRYVGTQWTHNVCLTYRTAVCCCQLLWYIGWQCTHNVRSTDRTAVVVNYQLLSTIHACAHVTTVQQYNCPLRLQTNHTLERLRNISAAGALVKVFSR